MKPLRVRKLISDRIWQAGEPAVAAAQHSAAGAPPDLSDRDFIAPLDKGYDADRIRERLALDGITPSFLRSAPAAKNSLRQGALSRAQSRRALFQ